MLPLDNRRIHIHVIYLILGYKNTVAEAERLFGSRFVYNALRGSVKDIDNLNIEWDPSLYFKKKFMAALKYVISIRKRLFRYCSRNEQEHHGRRKSSNFPSRLNLGCHRFILDFGDSDYKAKSQYDGSHFHKRAPPAPLIGSTYHTERRPT